MLVERTQQYPEATLEKHKHLADDAAEHYNYCRYLMLLFDWAKLIGYFDLIPFSTIVAWTGQWALMSQSLQ